MNKIFIYYRYLMRKTLCSWRMLAVIIVTILTMDTFLAPIRTYCKDTGETLSHYSPPKANMLIFMIMGLLLGMIGMLILWMNLYERIAGALAASAVTLMSMAAQRYIHLYKYSPVNWLQLDNHYSIVNPERPHQTYIILMLLLLTVLFFMLAKNRVNQTQENNRRKL